MLYPRRCPLCERTIRYMAGGQAVQYAHAACMKRAAYIRPPVCVVCGRPLSEDAAARCDVCAARAHVFDRNMAVWQYTGTVKTALYGLKYKNKREYARFFAAEALRVYGTDACFLQVDAVVPVPLHPSRRRARGYNQADCIAKPVAEALGVPFYRHMLHRVRKTPPLKQLGAGARAQCLQDAFLADEKAGRCRSVLVVDDIYTTGSTLDEAARALKAAGVLHVYCLTAAVAGCRERFAAGNSTGYWSQGDQ